MECSRCILDSDIPGISFDETGECSYCRLHNRFDKEYPTGEEGKKRLDELVKDIKRSGKKNRYDCIVGVSGGCDSSYLLHIAKELGLRVLAVHFDNNWNTPTAEENMNKMTRKTNVDFVRVGVDREEFDDICKSFLKASVSDADIANDIALTAVNYMIADIFNIKYILIGHSFRTEGTSPLGWTYMDAKYIESIQKMFGSKKLTTFPNLWLKDWLKWSFKGIKRISPLYFIDYRKEDTKKFLNKEYGWKWYGGHHLENKYTAFVGRYLWPRKFNIDYRKIEFSALIRSGQMKRGEVLKKMKQKPSIDKSIIKEVLKRLDITSDELEQIMKMPIKTHHDFNTYHSTFKRYRWFFWLLYKFNMVPKTFYVKYTK